MELVQLQEQAGNCAGFFISLGDEFFKSGVSEVDRVITPTLRDRAVNPRVIPSYAWFALKVRHALPSQLFFLSDFKRGQHGRS